MGTTSIKDTEKQWQELIERSAHVYSLEFKEIGEYENIKDVYLDASDFVRANLSKVPEVRELIEAVKLLEWEVGHIGNVTSERLNRLTKALKALEKLR